jgi:MFS transporter, BCD family, chlorophyll transporter
LGMVVSALIFGAILSNFSELRLIQTVQGAAVITMILNSIALWKQEARHSIPLAPGTNAPSFFASLKLLDQNGPSDGPVDGRGASRGDGRGLRRMVAIGLGTIGFSMQDILLEPYGGEILGLTVGATTLMTALLALGGMAAFILAERSLGRDLDPYRLAGYGAVGGLGAFAAIIFSAPLQSPMLFGLGTALIGFGGGLFAVGSLTAFMQLAHNGQSGLALGIWGAVQASAAGGAAAFGGLFRDLVTQAADAGLLGATLAVPEIGYCAVYHLEIALLFATLISLGPLVGHARLSRASSMPGLRAIGSLS